MLMLPEIVVMVTAFVLLFADLWVGERRRGILAPIALVGLGLAGACALLLMPREGRCWADGS